MILLSFLTVMLGVVAVPAASDAMIFPPKADAPHSQAPFHHNGDKKTVLIDWTIKTDTCQLQVLPSEVGYRVEIGDGHQKMLSSPVDGLWSIALGWKDQWPTNWRHGSPDKVERVGPWLVLTGKVKTDQGDWQVKDAYIAEGRLIRCMRRWTWTGTKPTETTTLSVRWTVRNAGSIPFLPGICLYGNPMGAAPSVAKYDGTEGQQLLCEEHRFPMPFASFEWGADGRYFGAALHTQPSLVPDAHRSDQWWSLGVASHPQTSELTLLSGPCAINGKHGFVKANQDKSLPYGDTWMTVPTRGIVEKTFYLEAYPVATQGSGFRRPVRSSMELFEPYPTDGLPTFESIIAAKYRFMQSRWHEEPRSAGFRMYPQGNEYVMGWCGQAAAPGYALLALKERLGDPKAISMAQRSLDFLTTSPFDEGGFKQRYNPDKNEWYDQDPVSQGQAMENFARAIHAGRRVHGIDTSRWEAFLRRACDIQATHILRTDWRPRSTSEAFYVSPLCKAFKLFGTPKYKEAALKAATHYASRHLSMTEPYWGGTLDAQCEDKEGAAAGFQAFVAVYEMTKEAKYLGWAEHAMDVVLSYTVVWDIDLPASRLRDHNFKTRGWTIVSAQNQHLDVYGVLFMPEIYRMGGYLHRNDLKKLALVMYRSCGQMIDPTGSQGEQILHTNFAQHGGALMQKVQGMRGEYSEGWTVLWITTHFLNAAAELEEMGVLRIVRTSS